MRTRKATGFTLIEVLIAALVLAIGLLGFSAMLVGGMKFNHGSHVRSQALFLAADMADRIRANSIGADGGAYDGIDTATGYADPGCATVAAGCSTAAIATHDSFEWQEALTAALPGGTGTVARDASGVVYTVTVNWNEQDQNTAQGFIQRNFSVSVIP